MKPSEPLSVVVLTKDEGNNIRDCLDALLAQLHERDEIIVVDSASQDDTVPICADYAQRHPGRVRLHAFPESVTFGAARNTGIDMARHGVIAMISADACPEPGWAEAMRRALRNADIVYGRQRHAPPRQDATTVSRGLRYHHFEHPEDALPETFASNVNAAYRRVAFDQIQFDDELPGSEDLAFAKLARFEGLRIVYAADAIVRHKDVATFGSELRKQLREGAAQAQLRRLLGAPRLHLAWASLVGGLALIALVAQSLWLLGATLLVLFAPTLRRLASPVRRLYKPTSLAAGALLSPLFDLAFTGSYLKRRMLP